MEQTSGTSEKVEQTCASASFQRRGVTLASFHLFHFPRASFHLEKSENACAARLFEFSGTDGTNGTIDIKDSEIRVCNTVIIAVSPYLGIL